MKRIDQHIATLWTAAASCTMLLAGCGGNAHLELTSLNYNSIDPPTPRTAKLDLNRCYWWTDADGQVWIAMESIRRPLFGVLGDFTFRLSLVLEKLPAGEGRNYTVAQRELRAVARFAVTEGRFVSSAGIVALYRADGDRLRGSLRLQTRREVSQLLGGWGRPSSYLMQGNFTAIHDETRGRPIAEATESQGWHRPPARRSTKN
ncbi:MAG: hypothetical protein ABIG44_16140 [Planctomycetota bacterium]